MELEKHIWISILTPCIGKANYKLQPEWSVRSGKVK
jgi:hypothetical protein